MKFAFTVHECEHSGDLELVIKDIEKSGGKVIHHSLNGDEEFVRVTVEVPSMEDFKKVFQNTNSYQFSSFVY